MSDTWDGSNRRVEAGTLAFDMLRQQQNHTSSTLEKHVEGCEKMQKRVLFVVLITLLFLVAHSPEAAHLARMAFPNFEIDP